MSWADSVVYALESLKTPLFAFEVHARNNIPDPELDFSGSEQLSGLLSHVQTLWTRLFDLLCLNLDFLTQNPSSTPLIFSDER